MLENSSIAELLAREAEHASYPTQRALRRAARQAFLWEEEAAQLASEGRSLTEFNGIGPFIEKLILRWIEKPPAKLDIPAIRSGFLTVPQARRALAKRPNWLSLVKGDLQMHTTWSDGSGSIPDMAEAAKRRNYEYIAITDHSKGLKIAGGIDEEQLKRQCEEIHEHNSAARSKGSGVHVLCSVELNLNPRGQGDMDSSCLRDLDLVLGCFHSALRKHEDQTERYIAALKNPDIHILGHPQGRIYNFRMGLHADWKRIFGLAAEMDKALEIDGYPDRQDLNVDLLRVAKAAGCRISLGTDSHDPSQLRFMEFSVASALLAGIKPERILNFMRADELRRWVASASNGSSNLRK